MTQKQMRVLRVLDGSDGSIRNCTLYTCSWFISLAVPFPISEESLVYIFCILDNCNSSFFFVHTNSFSILMYNFMFFPLVVDMHVMKIL